ncbi:P63C domain-containing protein [Flavobacterium silvaticum]|uniref:Uncharacterized protein n=1 Tax=Flavobacterium silvaticum TaxID=1852020 RepID=A0A972FL45_9FLAO|nr:hypothetical protein [Flavobacterium silvaticum]NMH27662.1 hypothetical protein [Flavobacterium silvaticum]
MKLFGYSTSSGWLADYLMTFQKFTLVPEKLITEITTPKLIKSKNGKKNSIEEVYTLTTFFDLCSFILQAKEEGYIGFLDLKIATTAENILNSNKIIPLHIAIAEISGQNFYKSRILEKTAELLKKKSGDSSYEWIKALPVYFIEHLFELRNLDWEIGDGIISDLSELLQKVVFTRLPHTVYEDMRQKLPKRSYRRKNYSAQTIGNEDLAEILTAIKALIVTSNNSESVLYQLLDKIYPIRPEATEIHKISVPTILLSEQETEIKELIF